MEIARLLSRALYGIAVLVPVAFVGLFALLVIGGIPVLEGTIFAVVVGVLVLCVSLAAGIGGYGLSRWADSGG